MSDVRDNKVESRFELNLDGATAFAAYNRSGDRIVFTHTEVPEALEGQGIGTRLVQGALDAVRAEGLMVVPECSFVRHFIETHADYADVTAARTEH